jgi:hypothetical protein
LPAAEIFSCGLWPDRLPARFTRTTEVLTLIFLLLRYSDGISSVLLLYFLVPSLLLQTQIRLGDLLRFNSNYAQAIKEYTTGLEIYNEVCQPYDR